MAHTISERRRGGIARVEDAADARSSSQTDRPERAEFRGAIALLPCRDGKTRRTQSGIFPLVAGIPRGVVPSGDPSDPNYANATAEARAVRLKGYGNAIQIDTAVLFIQTAFEAISNPTP
jgi:DNA (cytosine-5)-methyltransferase 1